MQFSEFESFRTELRALIDSVQAIQAKTLRDDLLRERFRTLFRIWDSTVAPSIRAHITNPRELFKLSAELETIARLSSKFKAVSLYRTRLRTVIRLADSLVLDLPTAPSSGIPRRGELFIAGIPDLPAALVPNPVFGWKTRIEAFIRDHPFDKSVFIMIRYRRRNETIIQQLKKTLRENGYFAVVASEHSITDDLYNPVACLLCCSRGIAVFDKAEEHEIFNPNVAYELGMLHLLGRRCLILKHKSLRTLQTDILMKLYTTFSGPVTVAKLTTEWIPPLPA